MTKDAVPPLQSEAELPELPFAHIDALLRSEAEAHGLTVQSGHDRSTWCRVEGGEFGARMSSKGSIVYVRAHDRDWLFTLQETMTSHLAEAEPRLAGMLRWSGGLPRQGERPPNFSFARVESLKRIGRHFLRLRLQGDDMDRFARDMIHFRLVLPVTGDPDTEWPVTSASGQTVWPRGEKALHRPAYTIRAINAADGWLDTDIFIHDGGQTCDWAATTAPGVQVGLTGPGGGGVPVAQRLLIGGDETAYPALARIIQAQPPETVGECWLLGEADDYPLPAHPGIRLVRRPSGEAKLAENLSRQGTQAERIWLATEKSRIAPLRKVIFDQLAIPKQAAHLAAYWIADKAAP